jgi:hypothetical protein
MESTDRDGSPSPLLLPPDDAFWRKDLGFALYDEICAWPEDRIEREFCEAFKTRPLLQRVRELAGVDAPTIDIKRHLVLVARAIERVKAAAIKDVVRAKLPAATVERWRGERGRWARLPLALELYTVDLGTLLDVHVCHRWHAKRRCVMKVHGRVPELKGKLDAARVTTAAEAGLRAWATGPKREPFALMRVFERKPGEVLVAFRRHSQRASLRDEQDELLVGFTEESVIFRFCDHAKRVDVTAQRLDDAIELANHIGSHLLGGKVTYVKRRDEVTESTIADFLARLIDPAAGYLPLVEIKAEMPGEAHRPVKTVHGTGTNRIEATLEREMERTAFARDWRTVHNVKVLYEGYRFTVHFPLPDGPLELTYSDLDRDTDVAEQFEQMLKDELGADISVTPRSKDPDGTPTPRTRTSGRPERLGRTHWERLLEPTVDGPTDWEDKEIDKLVETGLVRRCDSWFFVCGDKRIDHWREGVAEQSRDCTGRIEWPVDTESDDAYGAIVDREHSCPVCNATWLVPPFRPPLTRRVAIEIDHDAVWQQLLEWTSEAFKDLTVEDRGVASGLLRGRRTYLVYLDATSPSNAQSRASGQPIVWVRARHSSQVAGEPQCRADLAELLCGRAARQRLVAPPLDDCVTVPHLAASPPAPWRTSHKPMTKPAPTSRLPSHGAIAFVGNKVVFHTYESAEQAARQKPSKTVDVAQGNAVGVKLLLALLFTARQKDDRLWTMLELTGLKERVRTAVDAQTFYRWVKRTRDSLNKVADGMGAAVVEGGAQREAEHGYRLTDRYPVLDCQLEREIRNWDAHGKNGRRS